MSMTCKERDVPPDASAFTLILASCRAWRGGRSHTRPERFGSLVQSLYKYIDLALVCVHAMGFLVMGMREEPKWAKKQLCGRLGGITTTPWRGGHTDPHLSSSSCLERLAATASPRPRQWERPGRYTPNDRKLPPSYFIQREFLLLSMASPAWNAKMLRLFDQPALDDLCMNMKTWTRYSNKLTNKHRQAVNIEKQVKSRKTNNLPSARYTLTQLLYRQRSCTASHAVGWTWTLC